MKILATKDDFIFREATLDDLAALINIHVTSWNATYPNYHPKPAVQLRENQWKKAFEEKEDDWFCYVAQSKEGALAGFVTGNDFNDEELKYEGQLNKIHFLKQYQRLGLGTVLLKLVVKRFIDKGFNSMILFADPDNVNIKFYDALGGEKILDKEGVFRGAYGWKNLKGTFSIDPVPL